MLPANNQIIWVDVEIGSGYPNRFMLNQASIAGYIFNGTTLLAYEPSKMSEVYSLSTSQNLTNDGSKLRFFLSVDYVTSGNLNVGDYRCDNFKLWWLRFLHVWRCYRTCVLSHSHHICTASVANWSRSTFDNLLGRWSSLHCC